MNIFKDYPDLLKCNSKTRAEFIKNITKYDESSVRNLFSDILYEIEKLIISGDIDNFKSLNCFIEDISSAIDEVSLRRWYQDSDNPFQRSNVVILICKHSKAVLLEYLFSNDSTLLVNLVVKFGGNSVIPTEEDEEQHNAFYYAIRSNNIPLLDVVVHKWPNNYFGKNKNKLDELVSSAYKELKLKNILLKDEMQVFVENILIDLRFFYESSEPKPVSSVPTIKSRIQLLSDSIKKLEIYSRDNIDDRFIFLIKFIARNIYILKRQLKCTYATLPWEEIEFCLVAFVNLQTTSEEINLIYSSVLNKRKIVTYLVHFSNCIEKEFNNIKNLKIQNLSVYPQLPRKTIITNIVKKIPLFYDLYTDYKSIRDIHSLEIIKKYIELSLYVDCTSKEGQLIIVRTLQVIGEYFKNTVESPKLSNHTCEMLLSLLPAKTRQIIIDLRNSLSHAYSLEKRLQIEANVDVNFFKNIQSDVKKINSAITEILFRNKICVIKLLLERIMKSESAEDIKEICEMLQLANVKCDFTIGNVADEFIEIENSVKELSDKIKDKTQYEEALFKNVDDVINFEKNKRIKLETNYISGLLCCSMFVKHVQNFNMDKNSVKRLKCHTYKILKKISSEVKSESLKKIAHDFIDLYNSMAHRLDIDLQEELRRITFKVFMLVELQVGNMKWITELRDKLTTQEKSLCDASACYEKTNIVKEKQIQQLVSKVSFLESALRKHHLHTKSIDSYTIYKNDKKLQVIIEMLLLDIMSILEDSNKILTNNLLFLDEDSPLLVGRNLRNHLAHGNALLDILENDTSVAILINANKIISSNIEQGKIGKLISNNPFKVKSRFDQELTKIDIQNYLFNALIEGNFECIENSIKEGADIHARSLNLWTALHFASQGDNVKIVKFLLDQNLNINAVDKKGQTPFHIAAKCGCKSIVQLLLKKQIDIEVKDFNRKTPLHLAAQNGQTNVIEVLLKNNARTDSKDSIGCTPLFYAVLNDHIEATKVLLSKQDIDTEVMLGGFRALHVAAQCGYSKLALLLLLNKADANAKTDQQATPLHLASIDGCLEIVKNLVMFGAQINANSVVGTPLNSSVVNNHKMIIEFLLNLGADVNSVDSSNFTPLNSAAANGNVEIVKMLIDKESDIDHRTISGVTSLYIAAVNGHLNTVKFLLKKNAFLNIRDIDGLPILHVTALNGHTEIVKLLIENGAKVNDTNAYHQTPLHFAAKSNKSEVVKVLIALGANIDSEDKGGSTALHLSCQNAHQAVVKVLISNGANVKVQNKMNLSPLCAAISGESIEIVEMLIKGGADINSVDSLDRTPLHISALCGNQEIVKIILKLNCDINIKCQFGFTPLHLAVLGNHMEVVKLLIKSGAKVNVEESSGQTPLCFAVKNNFKEIVIDLIESGADINIGYPLYLAILPGFTDIAQVFIHNEKFNANIVNQDKMTPLHLAALCGQENVVSAMIAKGADVNAQSNDKFAALHLAAVHGHNEVVNLLVKSGAELNGRSDEGYTPLSAAVEKGHIKVVTTLLDHGADPSIADIRKRTSIQIAVGKDKMEIIKILLEQDNVNIKEKGEHDYTLLHIAAQEGLLEITKFLIKHGADINARELSGSKPIHIAAREGHQHIVKFYLRENIKIDDLTTYGETLLHYAAVSGNSEMVKYLISQKIDVNFSAITGAKPIHVAACAGFEDIIRILVDNGAHFDAISKIHGSALEMSKFSNHKQVTRLLILTKNFFAAVKRSDVSETKKFLEEGAMVNAKSSSEVTPLHYASWKGYDSIVTLLLKYKANPNVIGKNGCTPLHYATKFNHINIVKTLLLHKAGYNIACNNKKTPLDFAIHPEIAKLFNLIDESFRSVVNGNSEIISKLIKLKDKDTLKIVMNACNKDNRTLIIVGIHSDFPKIKQLKHVLHDEMFIEVNEAHKLCSQERYDEALLLYKSVHEKRKELLGIDNPFTLEMQYIIGKVLLVQHKYVEALKALEDVHQKQKELLGADNIVTLETKGTIAVVLHRQGKNKEALSMYMEVLPKQIEILGENHSDVLMTRTQISIVLSALFKFEEAQSINYELLDIYKIKEGPNHPNTLNIQNSIANILSQQGKFHEALELNKILYKARKKNLGPNHSKTLSVLHDIAIQISNINKNNPSTEAFKEVLVHQINALGTEHLDTLVTQYNIANTLLLQENILKSLEMYLTIFDRLKAILGPHHNVVADIQRKIEVLKVSTSFRI